VDWILQYGSGGGLYLGGFRPPNLLDGELLKHADIAALQYGSSRRSGKIMRGFLATSLSPPTASSTECLSDQEVSLICLDLKKIN
jgi:hypothetical protein